MTTLVELIPKKEKVTVFPRWMDALFYLAVALFIIALLAFFLLNQLKSAAKTELEDVLREIEQVRSPERLALEAELLELEKRTKDVAFLLGSHYQAAKFFAALEAVTHPQVQFTEISVDNVKATVKLAGLARDFTAAEQQFRIFNNSGFFREVKLSGLSLDEKEGNVKFTLTFTFEPKQIYK